MFFERKSVVLMFVLLKDAKLACNSAFRCSRAAFPARLQKEHTSSSTPTPDLLELTMIESDMTRARSHSTSMPLLSSHRVPFTASTPTSTPFVRHC
jgi:hypothetical protein